MKFNCGPPLRERFWAWSGRRHRAKRCWHERFAWFPTRLDNQTCVWLETYERILVDHRFDYSVWTEVHRREINKNKEQTLANLPIHQPKN